MHTYKQSYTHNTCRAPAVQQVTTSTCTNYIYTQLIHNYISTRDSNNTNNSKYDSSYTSMIMICTHTYTHTYIYTHTQIHTHTHIHTHRHTHTQTHIHTHTDTNTHTYTDAHTHTHIVERMVVCDVPLS
eukprot:GHVQ01029756.1.p2 GENE.GHVQ01029756.1~~GHVQ01029756.1.p2  ORF type:complete len:129 (-),score=33.38 GHVQ01029756.1:858-1244(-)